jgi:hypothetical protein
MSDDETNQPHYMRLGDGTLIDTATGKRVVSTEINKAFSDKPETSMLKQARRAPAFEGATRRFLDDLPGTPSQSRAVAVVCAYTIFGLNEIDIAYTLNIEVDMVLAIQASEPYAKFLDAMLQNIREHDTDKIRKKINGAAQTAADKITKLVEHPDSKVAFSAAKDILDRRDTYNGISSQQAQSGLTIRIVDDRDNPIDKVKVEIDG